MMVSWIALVTVLGVLHQAQGYGSGAPEKACVDMVPQHKVAPQTTPFPYKINLSRKVIKPGEKVVITISGGGKFKNFKGFLVQVRVGDTPIGKFITQPSDGVKLINCGGQQNAATHQEATTRTEIKLTWQAPPQLSEAVRVYATVAYNGGEFWVKQPSSPLLIK